MTVDTDKVVAAYTGYVTDMQAFGREPYQFELDLIAAIEQSQFDRDTYRDEAKGWLGRCDKIEAEYATLKAEYEQSQKELAFELETQTKQAKKLQALKCVQHMNGVLQKRVAELDELNAIGARLLKTAEAKYAELAVEMGNKVKELEGAAKPVLAALDACDDTILYDDSEGGLAESLRQALFPDKEYS